MKNTATEKQNETTTVCLLINRLGIERDGMVDEVVQHKFNRRLGRTGKSNIQRKKMAEEFSIIETYKFNNHNESYVG